MKKKIFLCAGVSAFSIIGMGTVVDFIVLKWSVLIGKVWADLGQTVASCNGRRKWMRDIGNGKYRYSEDGMLLVRKGAVSAWGGLCTMHSSREMWYLCSKKDPDRYFRRMVLSGWFGWHRFREGAWVSGIFYLLTCGCFGVFYLSDLFSMLSGDYCYREVAYVQGEGGIERQMRRIYYRPLEDRGRGLFFLLVAVVILAVAVRFLYLPVMGLLSDVLSCIVCFL